ncbi:hypothetical protein [Puniceicoccus vermicola]|uniref:Uncharacterized protein n=1 Tax=Puniceicoccus vermicola TaxID=388746 RepID=A0A7X1AV07_9BACT|nr:hypothetical protein [Puniceicoccus vermicola]MBC2600533.1 hypothetical protein [Puniceicoccus vermicola]
MKKTIFAVILILGLIGHAFWPAEYQKIKSPDGRFEATAYYHRYKEWLPLSPGQGGDKSGWIKIESLSGENFGDLKVDRISRINEIEWTPGTAEIKLLGTWNLE